MNTEIIISTDVEHVEILFFDFYVFYGGSIRCESFDTTIKMEYWVVISANDTSELELVDEFTVDTNCNFSVLFMDADGADGTGEFSINGYPTNITKYFNSDGSLKSVSESSIHGIAANLDTLLNQVHSESDLFCNTNNYNFTFDLGYPIDTTQSIENIIENGTICCRGYQSCAVAASIQANLGNILCSGYASCYSSNVIWTQQLEGGGSGSGGDDGDDKDSSGVDTATALATNQGNIFCTAPYACADSVLESVNAIVCSTWYSCEDSVILSAETLYCADRGCAGSIIRKVKKVIFIGTQYVDYATIYSGNIGETSFHILGNRNGFYHDQSLEITYYCQSGDNCNITCGKNACNNETMFIYCDGKCTINCYGSDSDSPDSTNCVKIITSNAPTAAPTNPAQPVLSEEDVNNSFNWFLGLGITFSIILVVLGFYDAKLRPYRKNELFEWTAVMSAVFYTNDFFSDLFFCLKLSIFATWDSKGVYRDYYTVLFVLSLIFIVVPLALNVFQMHKQLNHWAHNDPILKQTQTPQWIKSYVRLLYFFAIICGSSFSAVALCNSYLFRFKMFSMGLSRYHKSIWKNKRFFSIVLFEVKL